MCKIIINEVMLGKRSVGFECYDTQAEEIIGHTERQIKECIKLDNSILGCHLDEKENLILEEAFYKNIMQKTGVATLTPKLNTSCIVNIIFTIIGKNETGYEAISSRFWHGSMKEEKVKTLYELGAINGINIDSKGKICVYTEKQQNKKIESQKE